ncbi:MAG: hypothetical protein V3U35_03540 [Candidatus Neomarinimicrobiota bacterium]
MQVVAALEPSRHRFLRIFQANLLAGLLVAPQLAGQAGIVAAQEQQEEPTSGAQEIYRQAYETAMADSIISPEEEAMLKALQQGLGLHEDVVDEAVGEALRPLAPRLDRSGRWSMVAQNMALGMGLYGWGVPYVLGMEDAKWTVAGEMFSLGGALYLTWKYTGDREVPEARSQMQRYGGAVGFHTWAALALMLEPRPKPSLLMLMAAIPAGAYLGDRLHQRWRPSTGQAYALGLNGALTALNLSSLFIWFISPPEYPSNTEPEYPYAARNDCFAQNCWVLEDDAERQACYDARDQCIEAVMAPYDQEYAAWEKEHFEPYQEASLRYFKVWQLVTVVGYPLGTYLGHRYFGERSYTFGDALMLYLGAGGGLFYGLLTTDLLGIWEKHPETAFLMVTAAGAGGALGMDRYIRGQDYTFGQSALMLLGGISGGAFGVGLGALLEIDVFREVVFDADGFEDYEYELNPFYKVAVMLGSLGGLALTRRMIAPVPERSNRLGSRREPTVSVALQPLPVGGTLLPGLGVEVRW